MRSLAGVRWHLLGVAVLGIALGSVAPPAGAADEHPGRAVFVSKGCAACHEERAVLQAPHLSVLRRDRSLFELAAGMWNHAPLMWANLAEPGLNWPRLSPREMAELAAYLNGSAPRDPPPNLGQGQLRLAEKGCLTCHRVGGQGQNPGKDLVGRTRLDSNEAWITAMWNHAPTMLAVTPGKQAEFPYLDPKDIGDMIGFLRRAGAPR